MADLNELNNKVKEAEKKPNSSINKNNKETDIIYITASRTTR